MRICTHLMKVLLINLFHIPYFKPTVNSHFLCLSLYNLTPHSHSYLHHRYKRVYSCTLHSYLPPLLYLHMKIIYFSIVFLTCCCLVPFQSITATKMQLANTILAIMTTPPVRKMWPLCVNYLQFKMSQLMV